jgi:hypothetical protein
MRLHWSKLVTRHLDEQECLASFIAWQAAEVISRAKPANLINILDSELACGRNIHTLWERHRAAIFDSGEIRAVDLKQKDGRLLVLIYHPDTLRHVLQQEVVKKTMQNLGYQYDDYNNALGYLKTQVQGNDFPHEIGFFLGYPVKDVLGFMGLNDLPLVANGPWKMYGELEASLVALKTHLAAREHILKQLESGLNPLKLLQKKRPAFQQAA